MNACRSRLTRSRSVSTMPCEPALILDHPGSGDAGRGRLAHGKRHRLVGRAVQQQRRYVDGGKLPAEIGLAEGIDTGGGGRRAGLHGELQGALDHRVRDRIGRGLAGVQKQVFQQTAQIGLAVAEHALLDALEPGGIDPAGIVFGFQQQPRGAGDDAGPGDVAALVTRKIANHLAAAHGIADQRRVAHPGPLDDGSEVVGQGVEVITLQVTGRRGTPETAAIVGDHPHPGTRQRRRLIIPDIGIQRPRMGHDNGAAGAAGILDEQFDTVPGLDFGGDGRALGADQGGQRRGGSGGESAAQKDTAGCHGQAPLMRGARYAGLTRRQSQAGIFENTGHGKTRRGCLRIQ